MKKILLIALSCALYAVAADERTYNEHGVVGFPKTTSKDYMVSHMVNGCYQIASVEDLYAFAGIVNADLGFNYDDSQRRACAELMDDITVNENVLTTIAGGGVPEYKWLPIKDFRGIFLGNGHTISGLYAKARREWNSDWTENETKIGFFEEFNGNSALVKKLHIADSYFEGADQVGGIVGNVYGTDAVIDGCSFDGKIVLTSTDWKYAGGLVGYVSAFVKEEKVGDETVKTVVTSTSLIIANSEVKSTAVIGDSESGKKYGGLIAGVNALGATVKIYNSSDNNEALSDVKEGPSTSLETFASTDYDAGAMGKMLVINPSLISVSGVSFAYNSNNEVVATIADGSGALSIPQDIKVDAVVFDRTFLSVKTATMVLPFDVADLNTVSGATFYELTGVTKRANDSERDTITGSEASSIVAYKPYAILPAEANGKLAVSGAVTLKKTEGATLVNNFTTGWDFIATVAPRRWDAAGSAKGGAEGNNAEEIGRVYGFAGSSPNGVEYGKFVRAVTNVAINPLRAYLKYAGDLPTNCANALCKPSAEEVYEPSETIVFSIVEPVVAPEEGNQEGPVDQPLLIQKVTPVSGVVKADRWFDLKGNALEKKPTVKGSYIHNNSVVTIK